MHVLIPCPLTARVHEFYSPIYLWETEILSQSTFKPLAWKRYYISTTLSPSSTPTERFIDQAKIHQATTKFTAEISDIETIFLDKTASTKAKESYTSQWITYAPNRPTEKIQNTHFFLCYPSGVKSGFIKGEAFRLLRTNSS